MAWIVPKMASRRELGGARQEEKGDGDLRGAEAPAVGRAEGAVLADPQSLLPTAMPMRPRVYCRGINFEMISFMISVVPPPIDRRRVSRQARATWVSSM